MATRHPFPAQASSPGGGAPRPAVERVAGCASAVAIRSSSTNSTPPMTITPNTKPVNTGVDKANPPGAL